MSLYFVIVDPDSTDAFLDTALDAPVSYPTEREAIAAAKNYSVKVYVVRATSEVYPVERHKVTKLS